MSAKKLLLRFLAVYAIAFVLVYLIPEHIHRRDFDKAFTTWIVVFVSPGGSPTIA